MARLVEPGFRISGAVDAVELERRVADHGIDLVADDEGRGILVQHLDAVTLVCLEIGCLAQLADADLAGGADGLGRVAPLVVRCGVCAGLDVPAGTGYFPGIGEGSASKDFVSVQVHHGVFFCTGAVGHIVELFFRVFGQVARLVDTDTADAQVLRVTEGLVQGIGNDAVRDKVLGLRPNGRDCVVLLCVWRVLAETFYGTAVIGGGRIPLHWPNRANQVIRCRLFLVYRCK